MPRPYVKVARNSVLIAASSWKPSSTCSVPSSTNDTAPTWMPTMGRSAAGRGRRTAPGRKPGVADSAVPPTVATKSRRSMAQALRQLRARVVSPGIATGGTGMGPNCTSVGTRSCWQPNSSSQVTTWPVYAASRPMIAVSVLSATCRPSLSGRPARMLAIRSACSCTYGLVLGVCGSQLQGVAPSMTAWPSEVPRVPTNRSPTRAAVPSCWRHMLLRRAPPWPPADTDGLDGMRAERPVRHVDVVDVLLDDVVAREPGEVEPVPDLPLDVRPGGLARPHPQAALVPEHFRRHATTDPPVVAPPQGGPIAAIGPPLGARDEREPLLRRELGGGHDRAHALRVHGDRLFHEHVLPGVDGGRELTRPERGRRGEQHQVRVALEHFAVRVEPHEALGILDFDLRLERGIFGRHGGQALPTLREVVGEEIAQRHELDVFARREAVLHGGGAAPATPDQRDADRFGRAPADRRGVGKGDGGRRRRRGLDEFATRDISRVCGSHDGLTACRSLSPARTPGPAPCGGRRSSRARAAPRAPPGSSRPRAAPGRAAPGWSRTRGCRR